jgi:hypothetical protein
MAYIGVPQPSRAITSADIAQGAVTLNDISFTDMPANLDISGTIDKHTMRLAEGVTVTGDITISDNLILSKISDDGVGITLTNDSSTRTITGSGSIEASTLAQTPNASLTGMTGTVGSGVTGSPNLNLGNATFPAGHVIQTKILTDDEDLSTTTTVASSASLSLDCTAGNILVAQMVGGFTYSAYSSSYTATGIRLNYDSTDYDKYSGRYSSNNAVSGWVGCAFITHTITFTGTHTIKRITKKVDASGTARWNTDGDTAYVYWLMQEIKPTA